VLSLFENNLASLAHIFLHCKNDKRWPGLAGDTVRQDFEVKAHLKLRPERPQRKRRTLQAHGSQLIVGGGVTWTSTSIPISYPVTTTLNLHTSRRSGGLCPPSAGRRARKRSRPFLESGRGHSAPPLVSLECVPPPPSLPPPPPPHPHYLGLDKAK